MQKSLLKNTSYVLREDYPSEIENRRKLMYPLFLEAKQKDQKSRLNGDKVVYMGKSYGYAQAPELAQVLNFYKKGIRKGNGVTAFYVGKSIYSNFFPCFFKEGSTSYNCSEQMYQSEKCLFYGDAQSARAIMLQSDPVTMKRMGDKVSSCDPVREKEWLKHRAKTVMKTAVYLKFSQNQNLLNELKATTGKFV